MSISNTSNIVGAVMACVVGTISIVVFVMLLRFVRVLENHRNKYMCTCTAVALHWTLFINTLRPRQNGRHFADDTFKHIFSNKNACISIEISLKFVPKGPMNSMPALVQIIAWRRSGDKPLSELMMVSLPTHICVTRPQWVNILFYSNLNISTDSLKYFDSIDDFNFNRWQWWIS